MKKFTHYYCRFGYSTATANQLQEAVRKYFKELHGTLICAENFDELKSDINKIIDSLNKEFKRCTPYEISFYDEDDHITINGIYPVRFSIDKARLIVL